MSDPLLAALESQWGGKNIEISNDWSGEENQPLTLDHQKTTEQIRKLQIENEAALNNLIEKKMIQAVIEAIGQSVQVSFIDLGRRESSTMAAILGIPEKERDIESMINAMIEKGVKAVISNIEKLAGERTFS